jgi:hypothetical protein
MHTAPRSSERHQRILELIDACLAEYAAFVRSTSLPAEARPRRTSPR